jgi:hypothetical protein
MPERQIDALGEKARQWMREEHMPTEVSVGDSCVDVVELVLRCREREFWRFMTWLAQIDFGVRECLGGDGGGDGRVDVISSSQAFVASLVVFLKKVRKRFRVAR